MDVPLVKYIAQAGIASRRKSEELIRNKGVKVNGKMIQDPAFRINPTIDSVFALQRTINPQKKQIYLLLNKPKNIVATTKDDQGRKTVLDLVSTPERIYPVGQLDTDSTGLLVLTNDGDLANHLTHPRFQIPKTYELTLSGDIADDIVEKFKTGVLLEDGMSKAMEISVVGKENGSTKLHLVLHEGRKRQLRRMCETLHLHVVALHRIGLGPIQLGNLPFGKTRPLTEVEIKLLKS